MSKEKGLLVFEGFIIITVLLFIGELVSRFLNLPLPGSLVGLVLMVVALSLGIFSFEQVERTANILLDNLVLIFIPLNVSVITVWPIIKEEWLGILVVNLVTTVLVLVLTALVMSKYAKEGEEENADTNTK